MAYSTRTRPTGISFSGWLPPGVKWLLISNVAIFLAYFFGSLFGIGGYFRYFMLIPRMVLEQFAVWQLFTYMFLHSAGDFTHILFNMLALWMFGKDLENTWGTKRFLQYYFLCGVGAGICAVIGNLLFGNLDAPTIGASGAIYGLLLAFGVLFPDVTVLFSFLFPIKAKWFVLIIGALEFLYVSRGINNGVSNVAHLGGMLFGYIYLKRRAFRFDLLGPVTQQYRRWRIERAKRKFEVYMRKHGSDRDPWTH